MTYSEETDFDAIERAAWIAGNAQLAALAAAADDLASEAAQTREELEKERDLENERANDAEQDMATLKADVLRALEAVDRVLSDCKRISGRAALEAALQEVYNAAA